MSPKHRVLQDTPSHLLTVRWLSKAILLSCHLCPSTGAKLDQEQSSAPDGTVTWGKPHETRGTGTGELVESSKQQSAQHLGCPSASIAHRLCLNSPAVKPHPSTDQEGTAVRTQQLHRAPNPQGDRRCLLPAGPKEWCTDPGEHLAMQVKAMAVQLFRQHQLQGKCISLLEETPLKSSYGCWHHPVWQEEEIPISVSGWIPRIPNSPLF